MSEARRPDEIPPRARSRRFIQLFLDHHFSGFDDHGDGVAGLELHLFDAPAGDHALDFVVAYLHNDVSHDFAELHILDLAAELVASG